MTDSNSIANAIQTAKDNPYDGTIQQVCNLSISIAESSKTMDKSVFNLYKEKIDIEPKTFSKLKVIGEKLLEANEQDKQAIIKDLPASYGTLHIIFSKLSIEEIKTAIKGRCITKTLSFRGADKYVKQIRFPHKFANDGDKGRWTAHYGDTKDDQALWSKAKLDYRDAAIQEEYPTLPIPPRQTNVFGIEQHSTKGITHAGVSQTTLTNTKSEILRDQMQVGKVVKYQGALSWMHVLGFKVKIGDKRISIDDKIGFGVKDIEGEKGNILRRKGV